MQSEIGIWTVGEEQPIRLDRTLIEKEIDLENWAEAQPSLLSEGLTIVARQLHVEGGFLDLLAINPKGDWVIIELKRGRLYRDAFAQAIDYAACIKSMKSTKLQESIELGLEKNKLTNPDGVLESVEYLLENEEERKTSIIIAGVGVESGMQRVVEFLSDYKIPIRIVSFDTFENSENSQLLVREVFEEEALEIPETKTKSKSKSIEEVGEIAEAEGLGEAYWRLINASKDAGLFCRPYIHTVMVAPPSHKNRCLIYINPRKGKGIMIQHVAETFANFYSDFTVQDIETTLGPSETYAITKSDWESQTKKITDFLEELPTDADRHNKRLEYNTALLKYANSRTKLHEEIAPTPRAYRGVRIDGGCGLNYLVRKHDTSVLLWIDRGKEWADFNDAVYRYLLNKKEQIESDFGGTLEWTSLEKNRSRKISTTLELGGWEDQEKWPLIIKETVEKMIQFESAIRPHLVKAIEEIAQ